ncbi:MAG: hypothetical protein DIU71_13820 [Proteobacteria bacterium]|nr:MAG: hypothetical protein DIU71_13820 [Pseudomonadota bacterium]
MIMERTMQRAMDRRYIDDHHVVARYLADQLADAEREAFEAYYLEHPQMLEELEATARLKLGLARLEDTGELARLMRPPPWYRQFGRLAMAASLAIVILGVVLWLAGAPSSLPLAAASRDELTGLFRAPLAVASRHTVLRTRSTAPDALIELPSSAGAIELRVLPETVTTAPRFRVGLHRPEAGADSGPLVSLGGLSPDAQGFVSLYLNAARLEPGEYLLRVSPEGAGASGDEFLLRVSPPALP